MNKKSALHGGTPIRDTFLVFGAPRIEQPEIDEVVATLQSGWLGTGPRTQAFEKQFCAYTGAQYAIGLNSCTAGLHLSLLALGIGPGDEVITTPMSFCATANVIIHVGATPVFIDVEPETGNMDMNRLEAAITKKTKALLPVHLYGRPVNISAMLAIAEKYNLPIIEDAAHAIETKYNDKKIGSIGTTACFSFYATKNICTGEGGMLTTNSKKIADMVRTYHLHGISKDAWNRYSESGYKHYTTILPGYKYNMMDIQAALGIRQMERIDDYHAIRTHIWNMYNEAFHDLPITTPAIIPDTIIHARHLYTILIRKNECGINRDEMMEALRAENIGTGVHFIALHEHKYYKERFGYKPSDFPNAHEISEHTLSLPLSAKLTDDDVHDVINGVKKVLGLL